MFTKLKRADWIDTETGNIWYGIRGRCVDGRWYNIATNGNALVYRDHNERDAKMRELQKLVAKTNADITGQI